MILIAGPQSALHTESEDRPWELALFFPMESSGNSLVFVLELVSNWTSSLSRYLIKQGNLFRVHVMYKVDH